MPYSIDSDNKLYCALNICFRLPHWYCRLATSDLVFTGCPATEELEITGTFNFLLLEHRKTLSSCWEGLCLLKYWKEDYVSAASHMRQFLGRRGKVAPVHCVCPYTWVWMSKIKISKWISISVFKMWCLMARIWWGVFILNKTSSTEKRTGFYQSCSIGSTVSLYKIPLEFKAVTIGQSRLRFSLNCRL